MRKFLEHLLHYQCSRCYTLIPGHRAQPKDGGRHSHNGEFLRLIQGIAPTSDALLGAYHAWRDLPEKGRNSTDGIKGECRQTLAQAMRRPQSQEPRDAEESAMRLIVDHWQDTYIRHGGENLRFIDYTPTEPFPPMKSRYWVGEAVMAPNSEWFAVDLDANRFRAFVEHPVENQLGPPWVYIAGFTPMRIFRRYNGELWHPPDRDHYYARCQIPTKHWVFVYREPDEYAENPDAVNHSIQLLKRSGVPRIHWDDYQTLHTVMHNWHNIYNTRKCLRA